MSPAGNAVDVSVPADEAIALAMGADAETDEQAETDELFPVPRRVPDQRRQGEQSPQQQPPQQQKQRGAGEHSTQDEPPVSPTLLPVSPALLAEEDAVQGAPFIPQAALASLVLAGMPPAMPLMPMPIIQGKSHTNPRLTATGHRRSHPRITDRLTVIPEDARSCRGRCPQRPAIALCLQYQNERGRGGLRTEVGFGYGDVLSISGAANFGERPPDLGATVALLMPTRHAPREPKLPDLLALFLREAACLPKRFQETGIDAFLFAPNPTDQSTAVSFGVTLPRAPLPWTIRFKVSDLAGHGGYMSVTIHDLTPKLSGRGLEPLQMITRASGVGPKDIGDVCQDMGALRRADLAAYQKVADKPGAAGAPLRK